MNLAELEADVFRNTGHPPQPAPDISGRIRAYMNQAYREIMRDKRWGYALRRHVISFPCVASVPLVTLPLSVARLIGVVDRTSGTSLEPRTLGWLRDADPAITSVSEPWAYVPWAGYSPVARQPSAAATIFIKSTSASDTQIAYLEYPNSSGEPMSEDVTLTGTTAVSFAGTDVVHITKLTLDAAATGSATLHQTSGAGTQLAKILVGKTRSQYQQIHLYPTPSAIRTYYADAEIAVTDILLPADEPLMPADFHHMLALKATVKEWVKRDKSKTAAQYMAEYNQAARELTSFLRGADPNQGGTGRSQLGPWYEAGT